MNAETTIPEGSQANTSSNKIILPSISSRDESPDLIDQLLQCLMVATLAIISYLFISHYFLETVEVVGVSMVPTLQPSERYLLKRWTYLFREPQPNDIVVIQDPTDNTFAVKRIIAASGDSVWLKDGRVFVNGHKLREPYLPKGTPTFPIERAKSEFIICGNNRYFVMGDNRMNSMDSRVYGPVPRQNILGLVVQ